MVNAKTTISIGVLFDVKSLRHHGTLFASLAEVNHRDPTINLRPVIATVDISDSFAVSNAMCDLISQDVIVILGITNVSSLSTIQSYSNTFNVPFISIGSTHNYTLSSPFQMFMRPAYMGAVFDVIELYQYRKALYVYDTDEGLMRLQDVFQYINTRELLVDLDVRRVTELGQLADLIQFSKYDDQLILVMILDISKLDIKEIVQYLNKHIVSGARLHLVTVTLDQLLVNNIQPNEDIELNITGFQLVPPDSKQDTETMTIFPDTFQEELMSSSDALISDCIKLIRMAVEMSEQQEWFPRLWSSFPPTFQRTTAKCSNFVVDKKPYGSLFMEYLARVYFYGKTGTVALDDWFKRRNFLLGVYQYRNGNRALKLGVWSPDLGLKIASQVQDKTYTFIVNASRYSNIVPPLLLYKK
ncbi:hypothetical protein SNE40_016613 [Patella caerulea]|uniref:Receptor ligand binding region domain-containing protein n=1 Tax=Patella caerulea TaxID=87958 RepID=A0AAN8J905_PATCE